MILILALLYLIIFVLLTFERRLGIFFAALLAPNLYSFVFKPIAYVLIGPPILYGDYFDMQSVVLGLSFELFWLLSLYVAILVFRPSRNIDFKFVDISVIKNGGRPFNWFILFFLSIFVLLFIIGGGSILASNRDVSLSSLYPSLRYFFPFLLFGQIVPISVLFVLLFHKVSSVRKWLALVCLFLIFYVFNQRGFLIQAFLIAVALSISMKKISYKKAISFVFLGGLVALYAKILNFILAGAASSDIEWASQLFDGPDGAALQVWSIVFHYVDNHGFSYGSTLASSVLGLIPHVARVSLGLPTITDVLNVYFDANQYLFSGFGFNGTLTQDIFVSFGSFFWFVAPFFVVPPVVLVRRGLQRLEVGDTLYFLICCYISLFFLGSGFQTMHWWFIFLLFYFLGRIGGTRISLFLKD